MASFRTSLNRNGLALCLAAVFTASAGAQAGAPEKAQQEREACLSGKSGQDQAACLREVGAAREAAKRGDLSTGQGGELERNRADRCKALSGADQADCLARMRGEGTTDGSVKGGGIIREKRTVIPAGASDAKGSASTSAGRAGATGVVSSSPAGVGAAASAVTK